MITSKTTIVCSTLLVWGLAAAASTASIVLSTTTGGSTLGGLDFENGDLLDFTPAPAGAASRVGTAELIFDAGALFPPPSLLPIFLNIDAVSVLDNGNIVFSTTANFPAGARDDSFVPGGEFEDGDLIEFNPAAGTFEVFFDEDLLPGNPDIDAAAVLSNGSLALSLDGSLTIEGQAFRDGDVFVVDRFTGGLVQNEPLFNEDLFSANANVDAFSVLSNGNLVLSTTSAATLAGVALESDDLVEFDPGSGTARLLLNGSEELFLGNEPINAASVVGGVVPEPGSLLTWIGLLAVASWGRNLRSRFPLSANSTKHWTDS